MKVIAYGTNRQAYFDLFIESCRHHGIEPVLLGWGEPWIGFGKKTGDIRDYAASLPESEIILSVDPFDVIFLCGPDEIEEKFRNSGSKILLGAMKLGKVMQRVYDTEFNKSGKSAPETPHGYNYLNSGTYITTAGFFVKLIDRFISEYGMTPVSMDQEIFTSLYINGRDEIEIDWKCEIFHNLLFSNPLTRKPDMADIRFAGGRIFNYSTGTSPCLLHASGNALMDGIAVSLGYGGDVINPVENNLNFFKKAVFHILQLRKEIAVVIIIFSVLLAGTFFLFEHL